MFEVVRTDKNTDYTTICNHCLRNNSLSLKAKGLLTMILALPNQTWDLSIEGLAAICLEGQASIRTALKELEEQGYYSKESVKENGKITGWVHTIYEYPNAKEKPDVDFPHLEIPHVEEPHVENRRQLNTNILNTNFHNISSSVNPSSLTHNINSNSYFNDPDIDNLFNEFLIIRKQLKAVNSDLAIKKLVNKVYEYSKGNKEDAMEIISESIENSWKGIFPLKKKNGTGSAYMDAIKNRVNVVDEWVEQAKREGLY